MKNKLELRNQWRPEYPEAKDVSVQMWNCEFQTFMSDRRPGINVENYQVESPACFWVDYDHVYLRVNWTMWSSISLSSPEQVVAICNAHYCRIIYSSNNVISECTAPVYHISALPEELFNDGTFNEEESVLMTEKTSSNKSEFQQCLDRINQIVKENLKGLSVFSRVKLGDDCAPVVISNDDHAIIMDFLPENRNFTFIPPNKDNRYRLVDNWPKNEISLDFIEKLRKMQKCLAKLEPYATIDIGFLANTKTLELLLLRCAIISPDGTSEWISDFKLFSYEKFGACLASLFSQTQPKNDKTIADHVKEIIVEHLGVDASKVQEDANFIEDLGADKLDFWELTMAFEDSFGCSFPDDAIDTIHTVKDAIEFIENHHV